MIFALCTQLAPFKAIWPYFCILYQFDSFQDHMTWPLYCVPNWLLSRPYNLIYSLCTLITPFKTIWLHFIIVIPNWLLSNHMPDFCIVHPIDSFQDHLTPFQDHLTWFLHCVTSFINVYPIDSFQDHITWFYIVDPIWLLSRPFDIILSVCTQLAPFKTIWPDSCILYQIDSFQDHMT